MSIDTEPGTPPRSRFADADYRGYGVRRHAGPDEELARVGPALRAASTCGGSGIRWRCRRRSPTCRSGCGSWGRTSSCSATARGGSGSCTGAARTGGPPGVRHLPRARDPLLLPRLALRRRRRPSGGAGPASGGARAAEAPGAARSVPRLRAPGARVRLPRPAGGDARVPRLRHVRAAGHGDGAVPGAVPLQLAPGAGRHPRSHPHQLPALQHQPGAVLRRLRRDRPHRLLRTRRGG